MSTSNRFVEDIIENGGALSDVFATALRLGIVKSGDHVSDSLLVALECCLSWQQEKDGVPRYADVADMYAKSDLRESKTVSNTIIKRAIDIAFQRTSNADTVSGTKDVHLIDHLVDHHVTPSLARIAQHSEQAQKDVLYPLILEVVVPLAISLNSDFEIQSTKLVVAESIYLKLREPERTFSDVRRFAAKRFGTVMAIATYNKISNFVVNCAAENIVTEDYILGPLTNKLLQRIAEYAQNAEEIGVERAGRILSECVMGLIETISKRTAYID